MAWTLIAAVLLAQLWPVSTWTQFRHNAGNNDVVRGTLSTSWQVRTNGSFSSSPSVVNGVVYIGNNKGELYAIDAATGRVRWIYRAKSPLMTNPLVIDGTVIVGEGNQISYVAAGDTKVGTSENAVIAVDADTGAERWHVALAGTGMPTPALIDGVLVEHDGSGDVTGIDAKTGSVRYRVRVAGAASMVSMLPAGGSRFVTASVSPNSVWEIDGSNGHVVWEHPFDDAVSGLSDCPPASDGARIFCDYAVPLPGVARAHVGAPAVERLYALNERSGKLAWDVQLAVGMLPQWNEAAIPLVYRRGLYVGSSMSPQIASIDASSGRKLWQRDVRGVVKGGMSAKDDVLYFGDFAGYLWAVSSRTGDVIGVKNMHTCFNVGSPLIAGDTLIVGTNSGTIIALPLSDIRNSHDA
jgi:outer membrane protein assembly factor BamB